MMINHNVPIHIMNIIILKSLSIFKYVYNGLTVYRLNFSKPELWRANLTLSKSDKLDETLLSIRIDYSGSVVKTKKSGKVNEPDITADFMPYDRIIARLLSAGKSQDREAFISVLTFACRQVQSPVRL